MGVAAPAALLRAPTDPARTCTQAQRLARGAWAELCITPATHAHTACTRAQRGAAGAQQGRTIWLPRTERRTTTYCSGLTSFCRKAAHTASLIRSSAARRCCWEGEGRVGGCGHGQACPLALALLACAAAALGRWACTANRCLHAKWRAVLAAEQHQQQSAQPAARCPMPAARTRALGHGRVVAQPKAGACTVARPK